MTEVNRETVGRLSLAFGRGAERLHDRLVRDLRTPLIPVDEIFGYVQKKRARDREGCGRHRLGVHLRGDGHAVSAGHRVARRAP
ncbi:hypothetical protein WME81_07385 [Sorangium sp. So ce1078]